MGATVAEQVSSDAGVGGDSRADVQRRCRRTDARARRPAAAGHGRPAVGRARRRPPRRPPASRCRRGGEPAGDLGVRGGVGRVDEHDVVRRGPPARRSDRRGRRGTDRAPGRPRSATLRRSTAAARRSDSTNSACAAPADSASSPSAPDPAHRSSTAAPSRPGSAVERAEQRLAHPVRRRPGARGGTAIAPPPRPARRSSSASRACRSSAVAGTPSTSSRSPPSTCCTAPIAVRATMPGRVGGDRGLHLHRLDRRDRLARLDRRSPSATERHHARERGGDVAGVARGRPSPRPSRPRRRSVADRAPAAAGR